MKLWLQLAVCGLAAGTAFGADGTVQSYRLAAVNASALPQVDVVVDSRQTKQAVPDLPANEFRLLEDGKAGPIASNTVKFRDTELGVAVIVAIDASRSMEGPPMNAIRQGLEQMVSRKREKDRVSVVTFASDIRWETQWNVSASALQTAFRNITTRGNQTRLYDAVSAAIDEFAAQAREDKDFPVRRSILILSDGHDEGSQMTLNVLSDKLAKSNVRVDAVGLSRSPLWLRNLRTLSNVGFGGFQVAQTPNALTDLLGRGIDLLLEEKVLRFDSSDIAKDGAAHKLGAEHLPSHWRDELAVTVPEGWWTSSTKIGAAIGGAMVVLLLASIGLSRSRGKRPAIAAVAPSVAVSASERAIGAAAGTSGNRVASSAHRAETQFEGARVVLTAPEKPASETVPRRTVPEIPSSAKATPAARRSTVYSQPQAANLGLRVISGPHAGERIQLTAADIWIGSAENNDLCLASDAAVSGNHAAIRGEGGFYRLFDNHSLNNTFINGKPVGPEAVIVSEGDRIHMGQSEMLIEVLT